jgi:hypothetical protein
MIKAQEHYYNDNPDVGHPDVKTRLRNAYYFFLGNGLIQAAVQISPAGEGTPVGLLIMNPEELGQKRETLTFRKDAGLEKTMIRLYSKQFVDTPEASDLKAGWCPDSIVPTVQVEWHSTRFRIIERFYCPDLGTPSLIREISIHNLTEKLIPVGFQTSALQYTLDLQLSIPRKEIKTLFLSYTLNLNKNRIRLEKCPSDKTGKGMTKYWNDTAQASLGSTTLNHYFRSSCFQLPAVISESGKVDGSIWQYNREWVRDQAMMAVGLTLSGHHSLARTMLNRLLNQFVTSEGDTIDSSEKRNPEDVELDQNGELLYALSQYSLWTGDRNFIRRHWDKIVATAEFPLKKIFCHTPSGLVANRREYWERHRLHGVQKGMELTHQLFLSIGLEAAALLADATGHPSKARFWKEESARIKTAMLKDPLYRLVDEECFIKRRGIRGSIQYTITPSKNAELPPESPLFHEKIHHLNPDASAALPIAFGLIPPDSNLAIGTMKDLESLWNQNWRSGGYGRYHFTSEPDSAGPWPFPSLFIARAYAEMGEDEKAWRILRWLDTVPGAKSGSWFEFYGKRISPPYAQVGITPWTWAEMLIFIIHHIIGIRPEKDHILLRPRLLSGMKKIHASFPLRNHRLHLDIERNTERPSDFQSTSRIIQATTHSAKIAYADTDIHVKAIVP